MSDENENTNPFYIELWETLGPSESNHNDGGTLAMEVPGGVFLKVVSKEESGTNHRGDPCYNYSAVVQFAPNMKIGRIKEGSFLVPIDWVGPQEFQRDHLWVRAQHAYITGEASGE